VHTIYKDDTKGHSARAAFRRVDVIWHTVIASPSTRRLLGRVQSRTLAKVRLLDNTYDTVLKQVFSDASDETADPPLFGMSHDDFATLVTDVPEKGQRALTRVLCCAEHLLGIDHCVLLPTIVAILLNCCSESYAFCAVREMAHNSSRFFPVSRREHHGWCMAFSDILKKLHPQTAKTMEENGALSVNGLDPIFKFMFTPILRHEVCCGNEKN